MRTERRCSLAYLPAVVLLALAFLRCSDGLLNGSRPPSIDTAHPIADARRDSVGPSSDLSVFPGPDASDSAVVPKDSASDRSPVDRSQADNSQADTGATCVPDLRKCIGNDVWVCNMASSWENLLTCPYLCTAGTCTGVCTPDNKTCDVNVPQTCDANGTWQSAATCPYLCSSGTCTGVCTPGNKTCDGNIPQTCDANGIWQSTATCPCLCTAGTCTGVCISTTAPLVSHVSTTVALHDSHTGFAHLALYSISEQDAHDRTKICNWSSEWWEIVGDNLPSSASVPWTPGVFQGQIGPRYLVLNELINSTTAQCSGAKSLAESIHGSGACQGIITVPGCGAGSYQRVDLQLPAASTFHSGSAHPNYAPYNANNYTAKYYGLMDNGILAETFAYRPILANVVWSGPWFSTTRFLAYHKYWTPAPNDFPRKLNNAYYLHELEPWDVSNSSSFVALGFPGQCDGSLDVLGSLGSDFACASAATSPLGVEETSPLNAENRVYSDGTCNSSTGLSLPEHGTSAIAASTYTRGPSCATIFFFVSRVTEWWGPKGLALRNQKCDQFFPDPANAFYSFAPQQRARDICKGSENVGVVYQGYQQQAAGCEFTIYAWGNSGNADRHFRNGELRWSYYQGISGSITSPQDPRWLLLCQASTSQLNWFYTGLYQLDTITHQDLGY